MSLNIKNKEAYDLASELSRLTGRSMTAVVLDALRQQQEQLMREQQKQGRAEELMQIAQRCAAHIKQPAAATHHGDMLYDERGMPQ
jgi:antitoxin VapB